MSHKRKITKVSFKEAGVSGVSIGYTSYDPNGDGVKDKTTKECPHGPHITFQKAMEKLKYHLLFLTEFELEDKHKNFEKLDPAGEEVKNFRVCGVSISGEGEKEGVIITGYKTLSNGLGFAFNTPNTRLSGEYKFMKELIIDLENLKVEANEYLGGKYGAVQGALPLGDTPTPQEN